MSAAHTTVLLQEAVDALLISESGLYIDGTFGRGGHSRLILQRLASDGALVGIDKDPQACSEGMLLASQDSRFRMQRGSFASIREYAETLDAVGKIDGVLVDLGVSSPQLDDAERGFSFLHDGPLDMRMDPERGKSAADWVNTCAEEDLARVLKEYGEERFARRMARAVVSIRQQQPIVTTKALANIIAEANPAWEKGKHPATRAFQAIRIFVNDELRDLELFLDGALEVLRPGGHLVVISFHSLEDRLVKRFIRRQEQGPKLPKGLPVPEAQIQRRMRGVGKAVRAKAEEVDANPRARSAIMRVAEKLV